MKLLERDLQNGPYHCFGHHDRCSPDFCLVAKGSVVGSLESSGNGPGEVGEDGEGGDCRTAEDEESGHPDDLQSKFPVTNKRNQHK